MKIKIEIKKWILVILGALLFAGVLYFENKVLIISFEQLLFGAMKLKGSGVSTVGAGILYVIIAFIIVCPIFLLPVVDFGKKFVINIKNKKIQLYPIRQTNKYGLILLIIGFILLLNVFEFFPFVKNTLLSSSDIFDKYYVDSSNDKDKYTRNRYRKYVIPFLKNEDIKVHEKFLKFSEELNDACRFIDKEIDLALDRCLRGNVIDLDKFVKEDKFIQREILYYLLSEFYQDDLILVNDKHIELIVNLIYSNRANSFVNLPNEVVANKNYSMLELKRETVEITSYEIEFNNYVSLPDNHIIEEILDTDDNSNNICRLDSKDIDLPLIVRTRKIGDRMKVKGLDGSKKVKDIFIDKKIKMDKRDSWPIVVDSKGKIVWIPGIKKSVYDKKKIESYDIVLKYS